MIATTTSTTGSTLQALIYMAVGVFFFSVLDAVTKFLGEGYGTWQLVLLSRICPLIASCFIMYRATGRYFGFRTAFFKTHLMRAVLVVATTWTFYECLRYLQLADAIAIAFAAPLFMTSLSGPLLRERVGPRRWAAVVIGFVGVVIALRPGQHGITWGAILALIAAITYALGQLWLRPLSGKEQNYNIIFYATLFSGLAAIIPAALAWKSPSPMDWLLFLIQGSCSAIGQLCMIRAFKIGEASLLAPLEYTALFWATILGYMLWGDLPTIQVLIGATVIIGSSLYIAHREAQRGKRLAGCTVPEQVVSPD